MAFGDFTVVRSTVKRVLNSSGVLASVAVNTPAFEFNADGTYKGLLVEPAATNLIVRSQEINNASWVPNLSPTITANNTTDPEGNTTGDSILATSVNEGVYQVHTVVNSTVHTFSIFIKNISSATSITIGCDLNPINATLNFNAVTGVVTSAGAGLISTSVETYFGGWYRVSGTYTSTGTSNTLVIFAQGAMEFSAWGAQLETGSVATSYIPTVASTVTRGADDISLSSASSLIGQQEGSIVFSAIVLGEKTGQDDLITGVNSAPLAGPLFTRLSSGFITSSIYDNGVDKGGILGNVATTIGTRFIVGFGYKTGDSVQYVNGVQSGTNAGAFTVGQTLDKLFIADTTPFAAGKTSILYQFIALFPTRLANAQLATLTTL